MKTITRIVTAGWVVMFLTLVGYRVDIIPSWTRLVFLIWGGIVATLIYFNEK